MKNPQEYVKALENWYRVANFGRNHGHGVIVERFYPATCTAKGINKATEQLREALKVQGYTDEQLA